jgi:hypothetical protein
MPKGVGYAGGKKSKKESASNKKAKSGKVKKTRKSSCK